MLGCCGPEDRGAARGPLGQQSLGRCSFAGCEPCCPGADPKRRGQQIVKESGPNPVAAPRPRGVYSGGGIEGGRGVCFTLPLVPTLAVVGDPA